MEMMYAITDTVIHAVMPREIQHFEYTNPYRKSMCGRVVRFSELAYTEVSKETWDDGRRCKTCAVNMGSKA